MQNKDVIKSSKTSHFQLNIDFVDFVSKYGTDLCVICSTDTKINSNTNIEDRTHYVQGVGQICKDCYDIHH